MPRTEHLQIKIISLAKEARTIRRKERRRRKIMDKQLKAAKATGGRPDFNEKDVGPERQEMWRRWENQLWQYEALRHHRTGKVRRAAREALLAYGFIRNRAYRQIESRTREGKKGPDWDHVEDMVYRFSAKLMNMKADDRLKAILAWRDAGKAS